MEVDGMRRHLEMVMARDIMDIMGTMGSRARRDMGSMDSMESMDAMRLRRLHTIDEQLEVNVNVADSIHEDRDRDPAGLEEKTLVVQKK